MVAAPRGGAPGLFSKATSFEGETQPSVLSMRLQQILQLFSRSGAKSDTPVAPASASASENAEGHRRQRLPDRLALQAAIIHHLEWCVLFNEHLSVDGSGSMPLVPLPSAADSGLGQWLASVREGPARDDPQLEILAEEHQQFHQLALQALALARQGRMDLASTLLNTDFERSRARVLDVLRRMQKT